MLIRNIRTALNRDIPAVGDWFQAEEMKQQTFGATRKGIIVNSNYLKLILPPDWIIPEK